MNDNNRFQDLATSVDLFEDFVRGWVSKVAINRAPTEEELINACNMVRMMQTTISDEDVEKVIKKLQVALDVSMDVGISIEKEYEPWLKARKEQLQDKFFYWDRYVRYLEDDLKRTSGVIAKMDEISDKIIDLAGDPTTSGRLNRRGLLLGDIQSGKTANYIAVMNKAADVGYKVIVLLTGTIESLRRQTQERVDEGFIGRSSKAYLQKACQTIKKGVGTKDASRFATGLTTESSDFKTAVVRGMNLSLAGMAGEPVVFVLKKNARTLKNLINWLETYNTNGNNVIDLPLLLIDDEADNASINTNDDTDPTTINKHIRRLLQLFTKHSYLAVTATPFANIFIMPEKSENMENDDLFPADYIYALKPPSRYIGSNEIFGDDATHKNCLMPINDAQCYFPYKHKQDIEIDELPESLYSALRYFLLANVWRDLKKDQKNSHRSMLVNVSRFTKVQDKIKKLIQEWLYEVKRDVRNYAKLPESEACKNNIIKDLKNDWLNTEYCFMEAGYEWEKVQQEYLLNAINNIDVMTINQRSDSKLDYTEYNDEGLRVIAVGGLSLSRGLTLEGLMVSYFHRNTQMYDTLMQMGRWFGYREGYENLFKIWMPDDSVGWYAHITQASNELREDIYRMNRLGATPKEFGLKVKAHPTSLIVTARNKMKHAEKLECWITLDGKFFETPRFRNDITAIRANKVKTDKLIKNIVDECGSPQKSGNQPLFWKDVPSHLISEYVSGYENHPLNMESDGQALEDYIQKNSCFSKWDVLVVNGKSEDNIIIEGTDISIHPTIRPFIKNNNILSVYGTKMRIGTMGLTKHGLDQDKINVAENDFREYKRKDYELKYGDQAEEKLGKMTFPDRAYLVPSRNPILIVHYLKPDFESDLPKEYDLEKDLMIGYGMGFPRSADSEPKYAVYYVNMVELGKDFEEETEEDQFNDIDD